MNVTTDYFDRICAKKDTTIQTHFVMVNALWKNRFDMAIPHKKERIKIFYPAFEEIIKKTRKGHVYTKEEMRETAYWNYIKKYHRRWQEDPISSRADMEMRYMFRSGVTLYHSIKEHGMVSPLCVIAENNVMYLYRGLRRLVILKVLGIKKALTTYACLGNNTGT